MLAALRLRVADLSSRHEALATEVDPRQESKLLDFFVHIAPRMLNAERCSIFILDPETRKVWLKSGTGVAERGIEVSTENSIVGRVIGSGEAVIARDLQAQPGAHKLVDAETGFVTREILCVPIRSRTGGQVTGAIQLLNKKDGSFGSADQAFLEDVGGHLQSVVDSVFLAQEAIRLSNTLVTHLSRGLALLSFLGLLGAFLYVFYATLGNIG